MYNSFSKKDLLRIYNINSSIFRIWIEDCKEEIGIKNTKQTFTPKQVSLFIKKFGFPPYISEQEREYINLIVRSNT